MQMFCLQSSVYLMVWPWIFSQRRQFLLTATWGWQIPVSIITKWILWAGHPGNPHPTIMKIVTHHLPFSIPKLLMIQWNISFLQYILSYMVSIAPFHETINDLLTIGTGHGRLDQLSYETMIPLDTLHGYLELVCYMLYYYELWVKLYPFLVIAGKKSVCNSSWATWLW